MTITAKVVAHSRAPDAPDLITMQLRYPRMVHSEFMTHRVFSRNASSSRAVPVERMIREVEEDPAMPVEWGSHKAGMQAGEECTNPIYAEIWGEYDEDLIFSATAEEAWLVARDQAVEIAKGFAKAGYAKQVVNRLLEPFAHINVIVTATDWQNFFDLRCHPDADPTMRALAEAMRDAITGSTPFIGQDGDPYHLPYVDMGDVEDWPFSKVDKVGFETLAMISAARCARVSYLNHDGTKPNIEKDLALAKKLLDSKHMSPFEHQGQTAQLNPNGGWFYEHLQGNFTGWNQHRKILELKQ